MITTGIAPNDATGTFYVEGVAVTVGGTWNGAPVIEIDPARGGDIVIVTDDGRGGGNEQYHCREVDHPIVVTTYLIAYAAWQEHEDEPRLLDRWEETDVFACVSEAAAWIAEYATEGDHRPTARSWWSAETYVHPHTGEREERIFTVTTGDALAVNERVAELR